MVRPGLEGRKKRLQNGVGFECPRIVLWAFRRCELQLKLARWILDFGSRRRVVGCLGYEETTTGPKASGMNGFFGTGNPRYLLQPAQSLIDLIYIKRLGVEVAANPFPVFIVFWMIGAIDGLQEIFVA